ncbi:phytoene desaturase family protein [Aliihoeflea sp. PC F10.4]
MTQDFDAIIVGGGHNGLTCAHYLAAGGLRVLVLERRHIVGGAAVTEEFYPGFKNSTLSYVVTLLHPQVVADLELERHGLKILKARGERIYADLEGDPLCLTADQAENDLELDRRAKGDAKAYGELQSALMEVASVVRPMLTKLPVNHAGGFGEALRAVGMASGMRGLSGRGRSMLLRMFSSSVGDLLNDFLEGERIKGALGYSSAIGNFQGPFTPGTAFIMMYFAMGKLEPRWPAGIPEGGMGAVTQAMARSAVAKGVVIKVSSPVRNIIVEHHKAVGVVLENGTVYRAKTVVGNLAPTTMFADMVDEAELPADFVRHMKNFRCRSGVVRMNVALSALPNFRGIAGGMKARFEGASVCLSPTLEYLDNAYDDAKRLGWSRKPVIEMAFESTVDPTLCPPGTHVAHMMVQQCNPDLPDGMDWDDQKDKLADLAIQTIDDAAPGFKASVIGRKVLSPKDLEQEYGLPGGDVYHGTLGLDQLYSQRPATGYANYRSPVRNLYMCGSGTHPGGGVSGIPGRNAAHEILKDFRRKAV